MNVPSLERNPTTHIKVVNGMVQKEFSLVFGAKNRNDDDIIISDDEEIE